MTLWEFERIEWSKFEVSPRCDPASVPRALEALLSASDTEQATAAYWNIDNVVIVQGGAFTAALPTTMCAVQMLAYPLHPAARERVLELLEQLACADIRDPSDTRDHDETLLSKINCELRRGFSIYAALAQQVTDLEREYCTEILLACADGDTTLGGRAEYYIRRIAEDPRVAAETRDWVGRRLEHWLSGRA